MKLKPAEIENFLKRPPGHVVAVLCYGPDRGLVRERARRMARTVIEDLDDPFRVAEVTMARLKDTPSLLADEMSALSLTGGRRLVRFSDCHNDAAGAIAAMLDAAGEGADAVLVCEGGDLGPREALRKIFEGHDRAAALPCYLDEGRDLANVIRAILSEFDVQADPAALHLLQTLLGEDRDLTRRELEKLALYKGDDKTPVSIDEVEAVLAVGGPFALGDLAIAAGSGDQGDLDRGLDRAFAMGQNPISVLGAVRRHFHRLHAVVADGERGVSLDQAAKKLRPPVFFKEKPAFMGQARAWNRRRIEGALSILTEAELESKTAAAPAEVICRRALMRITAAAAHAGR